jgi:hypothetical protein
MPGDAAEYVADISAQLHGSMTPREILEGDMPVALGFQLRALQWIKEGYQIRHASIAKKEKPDRLR